MPFLIQLLLPRNCKATAARPALFEEVRDEITAKFGGVTVYSRAPAEGLWKPNAESVVRDDVVLFEVMTDRLHGAWWRKYRHDLERRFEQAEIVVRAQKFERL